MSTRIFSLSMELQSIKEKPDWVIFSKKKPDWVEQALALWSVVDGAILQNEWNKYIYQYFSICSSSHSCMHGTIQHWKRPRDFPSFQMDVHNLEGHHLVMRLGILLLLSRTEWASQASSKICGGLWPYWGRRPISVLLADAARNSVMRTSLFWWLTEYFKSLRCIKNW
jgi:hypothetical protein